MSYSLLHTNNQYTLTNTGSTTITLLLQYKEKCEDDYVIIIPTEQISIPKTFTLKKDGIYSIAIIDTTISTVPFTTIVYSFYNFFLSMIDNVEYALCGCNDCKDCDECEREEKDYLSAIIKLLSYNIVKQGKYNDSLNISHSCITCDIIDTNGCVLINEIMLGNDNNKLLMKKMVAYYYLIYYYTDSLESDNSSNAKLVYKYNDIIKCINKLGLDVECLESSII